MLPTVINSCRIFRVCCLKWLLLCGDIGTNPGPTYYHISQLLAPLIKEIQNLVEMLASNV